MLYFIYFIDFISLNKLKSKENVGNLLLGRGSSDFKKSNYTLHVTRQCYMAS